MSDCDFCDHEARAFYKGIGLCSWHLVIFYLGLHYAARA